MGRDETLSLSSLLDPGVLCNPYPLYRKMRERNNVLWDPLLRAWIVTRYDDCVEALRHLSSARAPKPGLFTRSGFEELEPLADILRRQMLNVDPPEHNRLKQGFASAFRSDHVESFGARIVDFVSALIDELPPTGEIDIVSHFSSRLPAMVIAELLGAPKEHHMKLRTLASEFAQVLGNTHYSEATSNSLMDSATELVRYFSAVQHNCPAGQNYGVIQSLSQSVLSDGQISLDEYVANCILVLVAGNETVSSLISSGMMLILRDPDLMDVLRKEPEVPQSFVEELLRYEPPTQYTSRIVPKGKTLRIGSAIMTEGQMVLVILAAGNRDPSRFTEAESFKPFRDNNRHLSFGWGHHFCFGAHLARMQVQICLSVLLKRLSTLSLQSKSLVWRENLPSRALSSLVVSFQK